MVDEVITQQLDYEPGRYVCRNIRRQRYARIDLPHLPPVIARLPTLMERSKAGPGPFEYLREVFTRMPAMVAKDYPSLAPEAWVAAKQPPKSISKASHAKPASARQRRRA